MFSANSSQVSEDRLYVEDVFSTYLYTGNGSTQTITNGIDLAGKGGLVWVKTRSPTGYDNALFDTSRGVSRYLVSNNTDPSFLYSNFGVTAFNSNGFSLRDTGGYSVNTNNHTYASWTFREAPKFFDVVTYTGNGASDPTRSISHNLGVKPGVIIVKATSANGNWYTIAFDGTNYKRSSAASDFAINLTNSAAGSLFGGTSYLSATDFQLGAIVPDIDTTPSQRDKVNASGATYVAYLFAHDTTSDGIIQCGSFAANNGTNVNLGWEPQWLLTKDTASADNWRISDNMRGMVVNTATNGTTIKQLMPNLTNAESDNSGPSVNSTGFSWNQNGGGNTHIYIAIRRGPMRTPTSGTSVFTPVAQTGGGTVTTNFRVDMTLSSYRNSTSERWMFDRLRGASPTLTAGIRTNSTTAEQGLTSSTINLANNTGYSDTFWGANPTVYWNFQRAPSFFDEVCYTGTGSARTINHNLGVAPELMIVKRRDSAGNWLVYSASEGATKSLFLNFTDASGTYTTYWNSTAPTASVFTVGTTVDANGSGGTYVAYLFASCPGVSKVGSYTGTGALQTINCGFTTGARFVLIKRTDSTGDWYVWDSARGITSGNDPYVLLNTIAAEVTTDDSIDPDNSGFIVNQVAATNINVSSATYIYLAVA